MVYVWQMCTHEDWHETALLQWTVFSSFPIYNLDHVADPSEDKGAQLKVLTLYIDTKIKTPAYLKED